MARRKEKKKFIKPGVEEHDGWKRGQEVWCRRFDGELACGKIYDIHLADSEPCFTFNDTFDGGSFRLALFSSIIPVPSAKMQDKLISAKIKMIRIAKRAREQKEEKLKKKMGV